MASPREKRVLASGPAHISPGNEPLRAAQNRFALRENDGSASDPKPGPPKPPLVKVDSDIVSRNRFVLPPSKPSKEEKDAVLSGDWEVPKRAQRQARKRAEKAEKKRVQEEERDVANGWEVVPKRKPRSRKNSGKIENGKAENAQVETPLHQRSMDSAAAVSPVTQSGSFLGSPPTKNLFGVARTGPTPPEEPVHQEVSPQLKTYLAKRRVEPAAELKI